MPQYEYVELCVRCGRGATVYCATHDRYLCGCPSDCFDKHHFSTHSTCELVSILGNASEPKVPLDPWTTAMLVGAVLFVTVLSAFVAWGHWAPIH